MNHLGDPKLVEKEAIANFHFPHEEVLLTKEAQAERKIKIERATALGNTEKFKCRIVFEDSEGLKAVETTVWASGDDNIVLKQGVFIPVHRIHEIKLL
ncbi:hypothetical protein [Luteibaculum oceani]|uniref:Uncharacterized protein n=1 Tax=Luteibaculum oceani TaxID=1294296 RepID=A0A5C6VB07_9FLAO|nr:hypothetical protein [Luteibaculum oceani]TXC81771.1 hypothetical protein FRX97_04440 [Luteibaculum oceani]